MTKYSISFIFLLFLLPFTSFCQETVATDSLISQIQSYKRTPFEEINKQISVYENDPERLNAYLKQIFQLDPNDLDLSFLQEFTSKALNLFYTLAEENRQKTEAFYHVYRVRQHAFRTKGQELLLQKFRINWKSNEYNLAYTSLSEIIRLDKASYYTNNKLLSKGESINSEIFENSYKAFLTFLKILNVENGTFQFLALAPNHRNFRIQDDFFAYKYINQKLIQAGYKPVDIIFKTEQFYDAEYEKKFREILEID